MNNLEKEVDLLSRLLKENREFVSNALSKYEDEEGALRMQKMLREYFKKQRQDLQQQIEEEALLILEIFPDVDLVVLQGLLYDAAEDVMRTRTVIQQLSSKNGFKRNTNSKGYDDSPSKKQKLNNSAVAADFEDKTNNISVAGSSTNCQAEEDYLIEKHNFDVTQEKVVMEAKYDEMLQTLMDILPDADPDYLQKRFHSFGEPADFNLFVTEALESRNYPKAKTTAKTRLALPRNLHPTELYTTKFNTAAFLEIIPDPNTHFEKNRVLKPWTSDCNAYAFTALLNLYSGVCQSVVKNCFANAKGFLDACDLLDKISNTFPTLRKFRMPTIPQNIALLQEIAYKTHYSEIMEVLKNREEQYNKKIVDAAAAGLVLTCDCCFDDAVLVEDTFECCLNCTFCKDCIKKSVEVAFGDGKLKFNCLGKCEGQFSTQVLQAVLPSKLFSKISDKRQAEEVKAAKIENLEFCPFCDFAAIPAQGNMIFNCLNPECARESCRLCKEPSHIPFRCNEVEQDENVKARTYVENKMSEALLKKCKKCEKLYFKDNGCNMMVCSCGAKMCDACGKLINNLSHFSQYRGGKLGRCPLWSDTLKTNEEKLREVAESAKREVNKSGQLKIDPTADIPNHFAELLTRRETASDWNKPDNFLNSRVTNKKKNK